MAIRRSRLALLMIATASLAQAQKVVSAKAGLVYFTKGRVWVDNQRLKSGDLRKQLQAGETLYTEAGRAEVLLNPGTVLRVGEMSRFRMDDVRLTDSSVSLLSGAAVITIKRPPKQDRITLHIGTSGIVTIASPGVYRFDAGKANINQARLRVFAGLAQVQGRADATALPVRSGRVLELDDLQLTHFNTKEKDELDQWAEQRSWTAPPLGLRPIPPKLGTEGIPKQPDTPVQSMERSAGLDASSRTAPQGFPAPRGDNPGR